MNRQQRRAQGTQESVGKAAQSREPILSDEKVRAMAQLVSDIFEGTKKLVIVSEATPAMVDGVAVVHYRHTCYVAEEHEEPGDA